VACSLDLADFCVGGLGGSPPTSAAQGGEYARSRRLGLARVEVRFVPSSPTSTGTLGATTVIDYQKQKFKDVLRDYDAAFDLTGGQDLRDIFTILKREPRRSPSREFPSRPPLRTWAQAHWWRPYCG
jgi:hypothetical protein